MTEETVNVAEAKKKFSELLGRVAFGKKHILITKRGKPMARLAPADEINLHLSNARGWPEDDDPFFAAHRSNYTRSSQTSAKDYRRGSCSIVYLLDTNILCELIKRHPSPHLLPQLGSKPAHSLLTSSICVMELRFGSALRHDFETFWQQITKEIISRVNLIPIGDKEVLVAGDILAGLRKTGNIIGLEDLLIAASAITSQYAVVTANIRHFTRIRDLKVENWLEPA